MSLCARGIKLKWPARFLSVPSLITSSTYFYCKQSEFWWMNQLSTDLNILIVHFPLCCFCCLMVWLLKSGSSLAGSRWTWPVINIKCYSRTHYTFLIWHTFWLKQNIQSGKNEGQDLILSSGKWLDHEQWAFCTRMEPEVNTSLQLIVYSLLPFLNTTDTLTFEEGQGHPQEQCIPMVTFLFQSLSLLLTVKIILLISIFLLSSS